VVSGPSSEIISLANSTHSPHIQAPRPAIMCFTSRIGLPQKEQGPIVAAASEAGTPSA
jgi:hypothetical protein